jgi:DNA-binding CsgD family transcriptional regulator
MKLTKRNLQVLDLVLKERKNREIAAALFISVRAVEKQRSRIYQATGTNTLAGLIYYCMQNELCLPPPPPPFTSPGTTAFKLITQIKKICLHLTKKNKPFLL